MPALAVDRESGARKPGLPGAPVFFDLQPIVLPVIERNAVTRQVGVLLTLELSDGHPVESVEAQRRQVMDAVITELYRIYGWRSTADQVVDETLIKDHVRVVVNKVLGEGVVRAVLIRQLVEQER